MTATLTPQVDVRRADDRFKTGHRQVIVYPPQYKDGELQYPYGK